MTFPFSIRGEILGPPRTKCNQEALESCVASGLNLRGFVIQRFGNEFRFRASHLISFSLSQWFSTHQGTFTIQFDDRAPRISYRASTAKLLFVCVGGSAFLAVFIFQAENLTSIYKALTVLASLCWFFVPNYLIQRSKIRAFLNDCFAKASE
jgi:hypothetical protein